MRIFKSSIIQKALAEEDLNHLVIDFREYKSSGKLPKNFGRDVSYDHPNTLAVIRAEEVHHIHLSSTDTPFPTGKIQFYKTSDIHLVYCQGSSNLDCYLLMAILSPNAHELALKRDIMFKLGIMAEKFRDKF